MKDTQVSILNIFEKVAENLPFKEGAFINKPPLFCELNYQSWNVRMKFFVESIDREIWDAITNGLLFLSLKKIMFLLKKKTWSQWTESEGKKAQYDCIVKKIITSALNSNEFFRVS